METDMVVSSASSVVAEGLGPCADVVVVVGSDSPDDARRTGDAIGTVCAYSPSPVDVRSACRIRDDANGVVGKTRFDITSCKSEPSNIAEKDIRCAYVDTNEIYWFLISVTPISEPI
jgi:hypothetical protein